MLVLNVKEEDKILIIAPHPDDECIGPGGLLALYPQLCKVIVLTDGRQGQGDELPEIEKKIRKKEFEEEMRVIGITDYEMLDYEDGSLMQHTDCLVHVDLTSYTKIFVTGIHDDHPDHTAACMSLFTALEKQGIQEVEIYLYEVHSALQEVTHILDITTVMDKKINLIRLHQSQLTTLPYDHMVKCLAEYRALQNRMPGHYVEAYTYLSPQSSLNQKVIELEKRLQKSTVFYWVLTRWMDLKIKGCAIANILEKQGIHNIAVYGYAELGQLLCKETLDTNIDVCYILDKKVKHTGEMRLPIYIPDKGLPEVDAVIVTAVYYFEEIKEELIGYGYFNIISLRNLLEIGDNDK